MPIESTDMIPEVMPTELGVQHRTRGEVFSGCDRIYKSDSWVDEQLKAALQSMSCCRYFWPTGTLEAETALTEHDIRILNGLLNEEAVKAIFIPENEMKTPGSAHWTLTCLYFDSVQAQWQSVRLTTKADGTCGDSLVKIAGEIAKADNREAAMRERLNWKANREGRAKRKMPALAQGVKLEGEVANIQGRLRAASGLGTATHFIADLRRYTGAERNMSQDAQDNVYKAELAEAIAASKEQCARFDHLLFDYALDQKDETLTSLKDEISEVNEEEISKMKDRLESLNKNEDGTINSLISLLEERLTSVSPAPSVTG